MTTTPTGPQATGGSRFSLGGQVSDLGYAAGWRVVRAMPELVARNAFDAGAIYASRNGGPAQLRKNLARVLGVAPARVPGGLIRASLASYARYWREAFRLPSMNKEKLRERIEPCLLGSDHIRAGLDAGRGVIMPLPHSGNWDMAGVWMVQHFGTFTTVAERLKPESLYRRFIDYRESLGFEMLPLTGGDRPPFGVLGPGGLPPALQPGAAAHEADRTAAVGAEGRLGAGCYRPRDMRRLGGFWGFAHPFQNRGISPAWTGWPTGRAVPAGFPAAPR